MILNLIRGVLKVVGIVSPSMGGYMAFRLFCRPAGRSSLRSSEAEMMTRADINSIVVNGKQVRIYSWGDGTRPVLMLHGWSSRASRYAKLASALLVAGYSPVTFDAPGHGESSGKMTTILEYEEISKVLADEYGRFSAIIGHSFGVLCLFKILRSPVAADKAIAISGVCEFRYLADTFSEQLQLTTRVSDNLRQRIEQLFFPLKNIWREFSATCDKEAVSLPILVIHDDSDKVVDPGQATKIVDTYNGQARLFKTQGLGHRRVVADRQVVQKIVSFIEEEFVQREHIPASRGKVTPLSSPLKSEIR